MKRYEVTRRELYIFLALSFVFVLFALLALFLPDELLKTLDIPADQTARYVFFGAWIAVFIMSVILSFAHYKKEIRTANAVNNFLDSCGESALLMLVGYYQDDPQNIEMMKNFTMHAKPNNTLPRNVQKYLQKKDHIKYAVICDAGIYIINMKDLSTPEKNILYRRNNTREHNILINPLQAIVLEYPECNALFVFSAANSKDITHDELLERLNFLYGKSEENGDKIQ